MMKLHLDFSKALGIPLDLTFGYNKCDDFSSTYTIQQIDESKTCKIIFNQKTSEWEGFADGQLLASAKETRDCCDQMFKLGYNIQDVDTSSEPELAAAIQRNGND